MGADRGDMQAALEIANMYIEGLGVKKNEAEAIEWYVKVAKSQSVCNAIARLKLLMLTMNYSLGSQGVEPDKIKARALFNRLFEVEEATMEHGQGQLQESKEKFDKAVDTLKNIMQKDK